MQAVKRLFAMKTYVFYFVAFIACLMLFGQEAEAAETGQPTKIQKIHTLSWGTQIPVSGTAVVVTGSSCLRAGDAGQLSASCQNYNGDFIFSSSNSGVATVTNTGKVTAVSAGKATISVQTEPISGSSIICKGSFDLTVFSNSYAYLTSIDLNFTGYSMSVGVKQAAKISTSPSNAYVEAGFRYDSSNANVLRVDQNGIITAVSEGTATITVISRDGRDIQASKEVTVANTTGISAAGLEIIGDKTMVIGEKQELLALLTPVNASVSSLTYASSSESVAKVTSDGTVTAVGVGTAEITVYTQDGTGVSRSFAITVTGRKVEKLTVKGNSSMEVGDSQNLAVTIEPANATNRTIKYSSSNINVVTVSEKGYVSANSAGTAVITVQAADGSGVSQSITITVSEKKIKVTSIALNLLGGNELAVGESRTVTPVIFPLNATNPELEWHSSNENIVSISNGTITGEEEGKAMIIVSATDGTGISASLSVSVYKPSGTPKSISLDAESVMKLGTEQIIAVVAAPAKTEQPFLEWSSSNENVLSVYDGLVSAEGIGTAVITAKDGNHLEASITIQVVSNSDGDSIADDGLELDNTGDYLDLKEGECFTVYTNYSVDTTEQKLIWRTSDSVVASVNQKGKITARRYGEAVITITTSDGKYEQKIYVTVTKKVYRITFKNLTGKNKLQLKKGRSKTVKYSLKADGTKAASYTFATTKKSVAKVNEKGRVTGVKKGKAKITLKIKLVNGKTLKKSFWAVVK